MNNVRSFWLGWGSLCVAGGGAYYFAKRDINANRAAKVEEQRRKKQMIESMEYGQNVPRHPISSSTMGASKSTDASTSPRTDPTGSPSQEASGDPAPTRHAPTTEGQRVLEKSKYESTVPFKSPKGDRFS
ncbi:hypothetical protein PG990_002163 [Apiospora arundinis]|uniref:Uncharacterized protein n=1 Tax=Apiospora arundinis TaxID=335852 RepID=A0ABR2I4J2_9PEZI